MAPKTALHSAGTLTSFWMLLFLSEITVLQPSYSNDKPAHLFYHRSAICLLLYGKWNCIKIKLKESEHILFPWLALTFQPIKLSFILVKNLKTGRKYPPLGTVGSSLCGIDWLSHCLRLILSRAGGACEVIALDPGSPLDSIQCLHDPKASLYFSSKSLTSQRVVLEPTRLVTLIPRKWPHMWQAIEFGMIALSDGTKSAENMSEKR